MLQNRRTRCGGRAAIGRQPARPLAWPVFHNGRVPGQRLVQPGIDIQTSCRPRLLFSLSISIRLPLFAIHLLRFSVLLPSSQPGRPPHAMSKSKDLEDHGPSPRLPSHFPSDILHSLLYLLYMMAQAPKSTHKPTQTSRQTHALGSRLGTRAKSHHVATRIAYSATAHVHRPPTQAGAPLSSHLSPRSCSGFPL